MAFPSYRHYLLTLASLYAALWVALGLYPENRAAWLLENVLVVVSIVAAAASYRVFRFSRFSYTLIFLFLCLHAVGAHYTYALVPYDQWFQGVFGSSLNDALAFERNNFDRAIHFSYGLLMAYPVREIFIRIANVRGFWGYFLPLDITMSSSALYEMLEWAAVAAFEANGAVAFLATQGDPWDAQKDMALASCGALIAMSITACVNYNRQRDFAAEWADSLRVKHPHPLGENALRWWRRWEKRLPRAKRGHARG